MGWHHELVAALLPGLASALLPQGVTNGNSVLGTAAAPLLPKFLTNNPLPQGYPWGTLTANGTNAYTTHPTTGVIRSYEFTISRGSLAPDGYEKSMILINGAFPGPMIEANWGDTIQVTVHNNITGPEEGTALHWHGFLQQGTPWEDGVPAVSQCPIAPGSTFTYQFQASLYGTAWYHSHYSAQYGDGVLGPIVVYGPTEYSYDIDIGPVLLTDYYHTDYLTLLERMLAPGGRPEVPSDNNLIQGKNNFDCATVSTGDTKPCANDAGQAVFFFEAGKVHRLRLINAGSEGVQDFSIDNHTLTVIAYDFVPIQAYDTKVVTLGIGQRADVLVRADVPAVGQGNGIPSTNTSFWMRSNIANCSAAKQPYAKAAVYYLPPSSSSLPSTANSTWSPSSPSPPSLSSSFPASLSSLISSAATVPRSNLDVGRIRGYGGSGGSYRGTPSGGSRSTVGLPGSTLRSDSNSHTYPHTDSVDGNPRDRPLPTSSPWTDGDRVPATSSCANDDLRLTRPLYPIALPPASWEHTFEIGMFVNASGVTLWSFDGVSFRGDYNAPTLLLARLGNTSWPREWNARNLYSNSSVRMIVNNRSPSQHPMHLHGSNFYVLHEGPGEWDGTSIVNPSNPMRRDVQLVRPNGHLVLQFDSVNPGVWPFHCHIAWHASGGFFAQLVVQPDEIQQTQVPSIMAQTCRDWAAWTGTHVPDQIDSGL